MQKSLKGFFFLIIFIVLVLPIPILAANFGVRPAYPREGNLRTESIFVQTIEPGEEAQEGVRVINSTNESKSLLLYARDSVKSSGGGFACKQISDKPIGVGSWIEFSLEELDEEVEGVNKGEIPGTVEILIPAGSEIIIPFTIKTPLDASVGEHNGCVLVQEIKEDSDQAGVSLSLRSGLRVAINIPGEIVRKLEFLGFEMERKGKSFILKPSVKNTGNVSIDTDVNVRVKFFGIIPSKNFGGQFPVLRDETYDFNFEFKRPFWGGLYNATAIIAYDASGGAGIGVDTGEKLTKFKSETFWFITAPRIAGIITEIAIFLILLIIFAIYRLNKKKKKWIAKWVNYEIQGGDSIQSLSKENKVHWEILVKVNKLKAPYTLEPGQIIKIPPQKKKRLGN